MGYAPLWRREGRDQCGPAHLRSRGISKWPRSERSASRAVRQWDRWQRSDPTGDDARSPIGGSRQRLRLCRTGARDTSCYRLYAAHHPALRRCCDPIGRRSNSMAAVTRSREERTMKKATAITCLFLDVGGVLLSNGWDHHARKRAAKNFKLELAEMEDRHHLTFDTYEEGKLTLEEYLDRVVFYQKRPFTRDQFRRFMFTQSRPYPKMIDLVAQLKIRYGLKVAVVSNESREVNAFRIREFKLDRFVDTFISSCFVHIRKPDADIFRFALDIAQAPAQHVVYIENTPMFVQIAEGLGIRSILHTDYKSTCAKLASFGLQK